MSESDKTNNNKENMKKTISLVAAAIFTFTVWAQSPEHMSYQAVVRAADNTLVTTQVIGMQISILQGSSTGSPVYVETHTPTTNANGLVSLEIGLGSSSDDFTSIDWSNGTYFIKTETDPTGGSNYTITGTSQLMSVPYAFHSKSAENLTGTITKSQISDFVEIDETVVDNYVSNNGYLTSEVDDSTTNEIQNISEVLTVGDDADTKKITNLGSVTIGTTTTTTDAALDINVTNGALVLPRLNSNQQNAINASEGMIIYNTTEHKFKGYKEGDIVDQSLWSGSNGSSFAAQIGQSFTPSSSGNLVAIQINPAFGSGNPTLNIYSGDGMGGTLLHSQTITFNTTISKFVLTTPLSVVAGQTYTFEIATVAGAWYAPNDLYNGGQGYLNGVAGNFDWLFRTYMDDSDWVDLH